MSRKNDPYELILGTSQKDRLLPPLNPDSDLWPKIDGRSTEDLKTFAKEFSRVVQYYNLSNQPDGTWKRFFDENQDESNPHYALFLAFLRAYKHAQAQINTLTQRHLEFYYKEVLHFEQRPAVPDKVHVIFELAKNQWLHRIEKGTPLNAGKDDQGNQLLYETDDEIIVNRAQVESVKTLYVDNYQRFYARQEARKEPAKDADGKTVFESWPLFGEKLEDKSIWTNPDLDYELGFAIASPILDCAEGDRTITLTLESAYFFSGLVAYYPFNGNANDESGNDNNGIVSGAALTEDRNGNENSAYRFNGINNSIKVIKSSSLNITNQITISLWFKTKGSLDKNVIISKGNSPYLYDYEWFINLETEKKISFVITLKNEPIEHFAVTFETDEILNDDKWRHLAATFDGESLKLYLNGIIGETSNIGRVRIINLSDDDIYIGSLNNTYHFFGSIDDIGIYKRALTSLEIQELAKSDTDPIIFNKRLDIADNSILVYFSGEKDWIGPFIVESDNFRSTKIRILVTIPADYPAIAPYTTQLSGIKFSTEYPVIKVLLNPRAYKFAYSELKDFKFKTANLSVKVGWGSGFNGLKNLDVSNDYGPVNPKSPFMPFGPSPVLGSNCKVGSPEVFKKNITDIMIKWKWLNLPDFVRHFANYKLDSGSVTVEIEHFSASTEIIRLKESREEVVSATNNISIFEKEEIEIRGITDNRDRATSGFVGISLDGPEYGIYDFTCLGHNEYSNIYTSRVKGTDYISLPEKPCVPKFSKIEIGYKAILELTTDMAGDHQFFHLAPFGFEEKSLWETEGVALLPQYCGSLGPFKYERQEEVLEENPGTPDEEKTEHIPPYGYLFIGLKDLKLPQQVSLLFQLDEGSGDSELISNRRDITWHYLRDNQWIGLKDIEVSKNSTRGLLASGIITFSIPESATTHNTILSNDLIWICASHIKNPASVSKAINIHTQAAQAVFLQNSQTSASNLLPEKIKQLLVKQSAVKKALQPYGSQKGLSEETPHNFYQRVNERLRHRGRGEERWDYEHLILQKFPDVYKAKCLNHINAEIEKEAGAVSLVMVPDLKRAIVSDKLRPKLHKGVLDDVKNFVTERISAFISFEAQNPIYEEVIVHARVRFHKGYDPGYYANRLNKDLIRFLAPWTCDTETEIVFGGIIHKSEILNYMEEREYVNKIAYFWIEQITHGYGDVGIGYMVIKNEDDEDYLEDDTFIVGCEVSVAQATTARSVLTSGNKHEIEVWYEDENIKNLDTIAIGG